MIRQTVSVGDLVPLLKEKIASGAKVTLRVKGTSMRPFYESGKTDVVLERLDGEPSRFDVILYESPSGGYVLHRILRGKDGFYTVCGDALTSKEIISRKQIIARVVSSSTEGIVTPANDPKYLRKVRAWAFFKPLRWFLLAFRHHILGR